MPNSSDCPWSAAAPLLDVLIPGDVRFPAASVALQAVPAPRFDPADAAWLDDAVRRLARLPAGARVAEARRLEAETPEPFARVLAAVTAAYYQTPAAREAALALAEEGPGEPDPLFDERLVAAVRRDQRGAARCP